MNVLFRSFQLLIPNNYQIENQNN